MESKFIALVLTLAVATGTLGLNSISDYRRKLFSLSTTDEGFHEVKLFETEPADGAIPLAYVYLNQDNSDNNYRHDDGFHLWE